MSSCERDLFDLETRFDEELSNNSSHTNCHSVVFFHLQFICTDCTIDLWVRRLDHLKKSVCWLNMLHQQLTGQKEF